MGKRVHARQLRKRARAAWFVLACFILMVTAVPVGARQASAADEFDTLRDRWLVYLTGGNDYNPADPDLAAKIGTTSSPAGTIVSDAYGYWTSMDKSAGRTYLWSDAQTGPTVVTDNASRLAYMAMAYATKGSSLQGNATLKTDILGGMDWIYDHVYNETMPYMAETWWDLTIGGPRQLLNILVLLYNDVGAVRQDRILGTIEHFGATPMGYTYDFQGANRVWKTQVTMLDGILRKSAATMALARDALDDVFPYVYDIAADGFHEDGSFIQHAYYPYAGGYGINLLKELNGILYVVNGSSWDVTNPERSHIIEWIFKTFEPMIYDGASMDMFRGRNISRYQSQDHDSGHWQIPVIAFAASYAPAADAARIKSMAKYWLQQDTHGTAAIYATVSIFMVNYLKGILGDSSVLPRGELIGQYNFPFQDRYVHFGSGYALGIAMRSTRTRNYEYWTGTPGYMENARAWYTSEGTTYLYNADSDQFGDSFWPTVDPKRLPGTTVDTKSKADGGDRSVPWDNSITWSGGSEIGGLYGTAGFYMSAVGSTLKAKKSYFMFDDEVVALGSGITSTDNRTIETIVENRKLNAAGSNALTVNGVAKSATAGWSETMSGVNWAHLDGTGGYYFPVAATVKGLRETRTGSWSDINSVYTDGLTHSNSYMTMWFDHGTNPTNGTYQYVLLPGKTSAETGAYAAHPQITVLENGTDAQAVRENTLNVTGYNFWNDTVKTSGDITSNKKASVMTREQPGDSFEIAVADPTQTNSGTIEIEIARSGAYVISKDAEVTVTQLRPTIKLKVNTNKSQGLPYRAKFSLGQSVSADTFDSQAVGSVPAGWTAVQTSGTVSVEAFPGTADRSVKLAKTSTAAGSLAKLVKPFATALTGKVSIEARLYRTATSSFWSGPYLYDSGGALVGSVGLSGGNIVANVGGAWQTVQPFAAGTWYKIRIVADTDADTFDLYVDNERKLSSVPLRAATANIASVAFYAADGETGTTYVDDVRIAREGASTVETLVSDSFDTQTAGSDPAGWAVTESGGSVGVANVPSAANRSVQLVKTSADTGSMVRMSRTLAQPLSGSIGIEAKVNAAATTGWWSAPYVTDSSGTLIASLAFSNGSLLANVGGTWQTVQSYTAGVWYSLKLNIDTVTDTFDLYVDGVLKLNHAALRHVADDVRDVSVFAADSITGTFAVDDVGIYRYGAAPVVAAPRTLPPAPAAAPIYYAHFESQTAGANPAGLSVTENGGTVDISEVVSYGQLTDRSVELNKTSATAGSKVGIAKSLTALAGTVSVESYVKSMSTASWLAAPYIYSGGSIAVSVALDHGKIKTYYGGGWHEVADYKANRWYRIKVVLNTASDTYDLYVDDRLKVAGAALRTPISGIDGIQWFISDAETGKSYVDGIRVWQ